MDYSAWRSATTLNKDIVLAGIYHMNFTEIPLHTSNLLITQFHLDANNILVESASILAKNANEVEQIR